MVLRDQVHSCQQALKNKIGVPWTAFNPPKFFTDMHDFFGIYMTFQIFLSGINDLIFINVHGRGEGLIEQSGSP